MHVNTLLKVVYQPTNSIFCVFAVKLMYYSIFYIRLDSVSVLILIM